MCDEFFLNPTLIMDIFVKSMYDSMDLHRLLRALQSMSTV